MSVSRRLSPLFENSTNGPELVCPLLAVLNDRWVNALKTAADEFLDTFTFHNADVS
jgi:hypothetical protein